MSVCRSCGQEIDWVLTSKGKKMPVDPEYIWYDEADSGTVIVTDGGVVYVVSSSRSFPSVKGRISHFATCPNANDWRV